MSDLIDFADAIADELALQRRASLERAGIKVYFYRSKDILTGQRRDAWALIDSKHHVISSFTNEAAAYAYAYELAGEQE